MGRSFKAQGEIFGVALMFVVIIVGVLIYAQFKALNPTLEEDALQNEKYEILTKETLTLIRDLGTGYSLERGESTIEDLIRYCIEEDYNQDDTGEPVLFCNDDIPDCFGSQDIIEKYWDSSFGSNYDSDVHACSYSMFLINQTLFKLFNGTSDSALLAPIPFHLKVKSSDGQYHFNNYNLTNLQQFGSSFDTYRQRGFNKVSSGSPEFISTRKNEVELEFYLFYK